MAAGAAKLPEVLFTAAMAAADSAQYDTCGTKFEKYLKAVRARHDLLSRYLWAYPTAVCEAHGQAIAEETLAGSFAAISFQEPMWRVFECLSPQARAAFLAEHLRFHFSGAGREGSVEIIEEPDRYRLVFDPCGSGGAMRRDGEGAWARCMAVFKEPSPMTWGRAGQVPAYCTHCAANERTSIERNGYPLWVTEFNPDPRKPCGWTVYKDPALIPARYFDRLGTTRRASK
jgi:hypothetical protein